MWLSQLPPVNDAASSISSVSTTMSEVSYAACKRRSAARRVSVWPTSGMIVSMARDAIPEGDWRRIDEVGGEARSHRARAVAFRQSTSRLLRESMVTPARTGSPELGSCYDFVKYLFIGVHPGAHLA